MKDCKKPPKHCGKKLSKELTPPKVWDSFTPYRAIGRGRPWIPNRAEHKAYLARNNYEEVGNDASMAPPELKMTDAEIAQESAAKMREYQKSCEILNQDIA